MALKFKLETGVQLLSRLSKKTSFENFYPTLFKCGLKHGEIIEIFSDNDPNFLLYELIAEALLPQEFGGMESGIIMFITDGNFCNDIFIRLLKEKLQNHQKDRFHSELDTRLELALKNLHLIYLYDATQFNITLHNIGTILVKNPNISLVVFNTLTAFYWSEQDFRVMKMDIYLKKMIKSIQKVLKDFKTVVLYVRPEYFSSSKNIIENLEPCCSSPTDERLNYRVYVHVSDGDQNFVIIQSWNCFTKKYFKLCKDKIIWK